MILRHTTYPVVLSPRATLRRGRPLCGMTLIELLVVIVILTTLVAGVIPLLSPNNESRKLREASRELQTYLMQAQAQAARLGRPAGFAFRETDADSGHALEVFFIEEPAPYSGFSENSRVILHVDPNSGEVDRAKFVYADQPQNQPVPDHLEAEFIAPRVLRMGDTLQIAGVPYEIVDPDQDGDRQSDVDPTVAGAFVKGDYYTQRARSMLRIRAVQPSGAPAPPVKAIGTTQWSYPYAYQIRRQATNAGGTPLQFPAGIGLDLHASGIDVDLLPPYPQGKNQPLPSYGFKSLSSSVTSAIAGGSTVDRFPATTPLNVGVMFAPEGHIASIVVNGESLPNGYTQSPARLYLLLGRVANMAPDLSSLDFNAANDEKIAQAREQINWLNLESRWVTLSAQNGRMVTSENAFFNPKQFATRGQSIDEQIALQVRAARQYARELKRTGVD